MGFNTQLVALRKQLVADINNSGLPACVCDLILKEICAQVKELARRDLEAEISAEKHPNEEAENHG